MGRDLREAWDLSLFRLNYQPQVNLHTRTVTGAEALFRCQHGPLSGTSPARLIHAAERSGLIDQLGIWVLTEACRQHRAWRDAGYAPLCIAVNVSAPQLASGSLNQKAVEVLRRFDILPEWIEIEVTETEPILKDPRCVDGLDDLRMQGFRLAIDDFGAGYASLSYLPRLHAHKLKIDRAFVRDLPRSANSRAIVEAVLAMGKDLGVEILAEGVENEEQAAYLAGQGCQSAQGYLFGAPADADGFEDAYLASRHLEEIERLMVTNG
ncbi:MAG: EAL domain-containing protein [Betaproteobacteria bacterium]|nr:EAL domain-containing protein [Betaproteobacteria bacterium]